MDPRFTPTFRVLPIAAPAAGAEIVVRPDGGAGWLVRSIRYSLATSAVVAARHSGVIATDTTREYFHTASGATQAASLTRTYGGYAGSSGTASTGIVIGVGLPGDGLWLPWGHELHTITENIDVADQYGEIVVSVFEFKAGEGFVLWPFVATLTEQSE